MTLNSPCSNLEVSESIARSVPLSAQRGEPNYTDRAAHSSRATGHTLIKTLSLYRSLDRTKGRLSSRPHPDGACAHEIPADG